jgi:hypothetical protein
LWYSDQLAIEPKTSAIEQKALKPKDNGKPVHAAVNAVVPTMLL